jgi:hypothetical protein
MVKQSGHQHLERQAVLEWLRLARHQAVDSYRAGSDTVRDSCLEDVGTCDLYVLILGHRYGFQPAADNPEGLSITQLEFRRAGECGIPRVALLRTSVPDVRTSDLLDPARAPLVLGFRAEVASQVRAAEFSDLQGLIQGLSTGVQGELARRDKRQAGLAAEPALRLAPRPVFLAGREELLGELDARLAGDGGAWPRVAVLCGLGGAGKTSVAVEYAHRQLGRVGVCWQFAAEDPEVLAAQFGVLAAQLGARGLADARDPVVAVHAMLARAEADWLVVFDNVPDLASVEAFLPPAGSGRVLVTSQSQHWPAGWTVQVPVLDPAVAAQFLTARTGDADNSTALKLAKELDGLPLALEQAAAYMQATGTPLARYLPLFRARHADLLARGEAAGHREHTAATLGLALTRLGKSAPAAGLLRLLAFLASEPVPLGLLLARENAAEWLEAETAEMLRPLLGDPVALGDAVAALRRYSLAAPAGDGLVQVHRLVQAVARAQLTDREASQWQRAAAAVVDMAVPTDAELPGAWPTCAALLPHARTVLDLTSEGMWEIARYLGFSGSYQAARDQFALIADAHRDSEDYGPEHPATLRARASPADWAGEAGDEVGARDQFAALLPIEELVLGPGYPDTLATRANLARWTGQTGDAAGARDQYAALLPVIGRVLGPEHRETLTARANLARWTGAAGDAAGARDQYAALLPIRERVLGSEHPSTLTARTNLTHWTERAKTADPDASLSIKDRRPRRPAGRGCYGPSNAPVSPRHTGALRRAVPALRPEG